MLQDLINKIKTGGGTSDSEAGPGLDKIKWTISSIASLVALAAEAITGTGYVPRLPDPTSRGITSLLNGADRYEIIPDSNTFFNGMNGMMRKLSIVAGQVEAGEQSREKSHMLIKTFYDMKTVVPENIFYGFFLANQLQTGTEKAPSTQIMSPYSAQFASATGTSLIQPYHIKSINFKVLPTDITAEKVLFVPFPTVDISAVDYEFSIDFEEDAYGSVFQFLQWAYQRVVDQGYHHNTRNYVIGDFIVFIYNTKYDNIQTITFHEVFLKSAGNVSLDYTSSNIKSYSVSFQASFRTVTTYNFIDLLNTMTAIFNETAKATVDPTALGDIKSTLKKLF